MLSFSFEYSSRPVLENAYMSPPQCRAIPDPRTGWYNRPSNCNVYDFIQLVFAYNVLHGL